MAYAVVDFETTGILPSYNHRVVEIGITHVEHDGSISGRWETLLNPERDLGPQHIHGVRGADLLDAPRFSDIAGDVVNLLSGRTFVAHNAVFDVRFLAAEFNRAGLEISEAVPKLCTMSLSRPFGVPGRGGLDECCAHFGIELVDAHSAGADSFAAAELLSAYIRNSIHLEEWQNFWHETVYRGRTFAYPDVASNGVVWKPRGTTLSEYSHFLELISDPPLDVDASGDELQYLDMLDKCLLDGVISASEGAQLGEVANNLGLGVTGAERLHRRYFGALKSRAWADGVLTEEESAELLNVAEMLRLDPTVSTLAKPDVESADDPWEPSAFALDPGSHVVLTGTMSVERSIWEQRLRDAGFVPHPRITKKAHLLVSADPDSMSGKARQARSYGVPVVGEEWLIDYFNRAH